MNIFNFLLPTLSHFHIFGYWLAFLSAFLETIIGFGYFLPGSTIILFLGAFAAQGYFDVGDLIWFAIAGAIVGDNINYYLGRKFGLKWAQKGIWLLKSEYFQRAKKFFDEHGAKSIFLGRFVPAMKETLPFVAGSVGMQRRKFLIWNILGALGWGLEWVGIGYFFAKSLSAAQLWLSRSGFFLSIFFAALIIFYIIKWIVINYGRGFFLFLFSIWRSVKQAIKDNSDVRKIISKHPLFFNFLKKRLGKGKFSGWPLTFLSLSFIYIFLQFAGVIKNIVTAAPIVSADQRVINLLYIFRSPKFVKFFLWLTLFGKWQIVFVLTIFVLISLWILRRRLYIIPFLFTLGFTETFVFINKLLFHRARPVNAIYVEHSFSFPSGHAAVSIAFYGFIAYILIRQIKGWKKKVNIFFTALLLILGIGFSRLYLGVHYLSDVWGGYLLASLWLIFGISLAEYLREKLKIKNYSGFIFNQKNKIILFILFFSSIMLYIGFGLRYRPLSLALNYHPDVKKITVSKPLDIFAKQEIPKYTKTLSGAPQEPMSFMIITKNDKELVDDFYRAGWYLADSVSLQSVEKIAQAALVKSEYLQAPMTPSFWNTKVHDFGFEKPTNTENVRQRHHARFWRTHFKTEDGENIYVGTASLDVGIKWGVTHRIGPDIDTEREFLFSDLKKNNLIKEWRKEQFVAPHLGKNFSGDPFFTDGKIYILEF